MNHKELTNDLFRKHFPEWLSEAHVEKVMQRTIEAFEKRNVPAFYHSLNPQAKRDRWERRQEKIERKALERSPKLNNKIIQKIVNEENIQPSLFD